MDFARHEARMRKPATEGSAVSVRATLEASAARGVPSAIKLLEAAPPFPEALGELWEQFEQLDAMRGQGMSGPAGFTPSDIDAANRLFGWDLQPHEVGALYALDLVTRFPDAGEG